MLGLLFKIIFLLCFAVSAKRKIGEGLLQEALRVGAVNGSSSFEDCIWRDVGNTCPDPLISYTMFTRGSENEVKKSEVDMNSRAWLHSSGWNVALQTVILIHGYGGTADYLPAGVLKDAYLQNGTYNVIVVDWGALARLPCYITSVHNLKPAAKCISQLFIYLRNSGVNMNSSTCIGHSLGAHMCGIITNYLPFRLHKIIGIDPARPLVPNEIKSRLDAGDAEVVQVIHTSSNYGDSRKTGHVDFYFNGGRIQPFCLNATNQELCSHMRSVCYLAESLFTPLERHATRCRKRNLHGDGVLDQIANVNSVPVGQNTPDGTFGTFCISNKDAPFCKKDSSEFGNVHCCEPGVSPVALPALTATSNQQNPQLRDVSEIDDGNFFK